jgi:hypothetical protein
MISRHQARSRRRKVRLLLAAASVLATATLVLEPALIPLALDVIVFIALRIAIVGTRPPGQIAARARPPGRSRGR